MIDIERLFAIHRLGAKLLFPDVPSPMREFAKFFTYKSFADIYRFLIQISTVAFIMRKILRFGNRYFDKGDSYMENITPKICELLVTGLQEFPAYILDYMSE